MLFGSVSSPLGGLVLVKAGRAVQVDWQRNWRCGVCRVWLIPVLLTCLLATGLYTGKGDEKPPASPPPDTHQGIWTGRRRYKSLWVPHRCCLFQVSMPFEMASHCCSQRTWITCRYCVMSISPANLSQAFWTSQMAPLLAQLNPASGQEVLLSSVQGRQCHMQ